MPPCAFINPLAHASSTAATLVAARTFFTTIRDPAMLAICIVVLGLSAAIHADRAQP
jgi:hypothetical protein